MGQKENSPVSELRQLPLAADIPSHKGDVREVAWPQTNLRTAPIDHTDSAGQFQGSSSGKLPGEPNEAERTVVESPFPPKRI